MPPSDYERLCSLENLRRAYRWTQSNPDARYKSFFRDSYSAYAASSDSNLRRLRKHLRREAFEAGHASKVYLPKPSGILRPYSLLTVNDQIVYQACANLIAEKLRPKIRHRYLKTIFGHLYAGKSSKFFYLKWQNGYKAYSDSVRMNIHSGYRYVANFDLASFYDSIDHHVLAHFLAETGIGPNLIEFFLACLKRWTSNTWVSLPAAIYHEHGIPQGPLASGIVSEVVLHHIDNRGIKRGHVRYLRYVDDIKLFARDESVLRQRLVGLDLASKEIGLFPQSAKVNIRKVLNVAKEIKSVSIPPEPSLRPLPDQVTLRRRLLELTRRGKVKSELSTKFKFLLSRALPHSSLNSRFLKVLCSQPAYHFQIARYFSAYKILPKKCSEEIIDFVKGEEVYHAVHASILFATLENMPESKRPECLRFCRKRLLSPKKGMPRPQPTYQAALIAWLLKWNNITYGELSKLLSNTGDWWVAKDVLKHLSEDLYGKPSFSRLLNDIAHNQSEEPARIAALSIEDHGFSFRKPHRNANESARLLLHASGKIRSVGRPVSMVTSVLPYVLSTKLPFIDWPHFFGKGHRDAEHIAFTIKRYFESDINAFIVTLDSFFDFLWEMVFYLELSGKTYGNYGSMLNHPTLVKKYPQASLGFGALHKLRLQSVTAHPRNKGVSNRRLKHYDFYKVRKGVQVAVKEVIENFPPC